MIINKININNSFKRKPAIPERKNGNGITKKIIILKFDDSFKPIPSSYRKAFFDQEAQKAHADKNVLKAKLMQERFDKELAESKFLDINL